MIYLAALAVVVGIGLPIAVLAAATAQGRAASTALESIARQPEASGKLQLAMILSLAFIESLILFTFVIHILLLLKLPETEAVLAVIGGGG